MTGNFKFCRLDSIVISKGGEYSGLIDVILTQSLTVFPVEPRKKFLLDFKLEPN